MVGFETNIEVNRKATRYKPLLTRVKPQYLKINFINVSMEALGIFESSSDSMICMMKELDNDDITKNEIINKIIAVSIAVMCT